MPSNCISWTAKVNIALIRRASSSHTHPTPPTHKIELRIMQLIFCSRALHNVISPESKHHNCTYKSYCFYNSYTLLCSDLLNALLFILHKLGVCQLNVYKHSECQGTSRLIRNNKILPTFSHSTIEKCIHVVTYTGELLSSCHFIHLISNSTIDRCILYETESF